MPQLNGFRHFCAAAIVVLAVLVFVPSAFAQSVDSSTSSQGADALLRLGDLFSKDQSVPADLPKAYGYYLKAAEAGSFDAKLRVAEMLLRGQGVAQDAERGQALIDELARTANTETFVLLGDFYRSRVGVLPEAATKALDYYGMAARHGVPKALIGIGDTLALIKPNAPDGAAIIAAYAQAAESGNVEALLRLGDAYRGGQVIAADQSKAFSWYARAAAVGSSTGALMVAEMRTLGQGVPQDVAGGLSALKEIARNGNPRALMSIANAMASGAAGPVEAGSIIRTYQDAAAQGQVDAWLKLGDLYSAGVLLPPDLTKARAAYQKAADLGNPWGYYALGVRYLNGDFRLAGSPADGMRLLKMAETAGVSDATVAIADGQIFGYGTERDLESGLALLEGAAEAGNAAAASRLVAIYRDGILKSGQRIMRADRTKARALLDRYASLYDRGDWHYEQALLFASTAEARFDGEAILAIARELSPRHQISLMRRLLAINENAYVYVVQSQLKRIGLFDGDINGLLTRSTIRAFNQFCARANAEHSCRLGPATSQTAQVLAAAFWAPSPERVLSSEIRS